MDSATARGIASQFRIRGSATYECCAGEIGLTDKQAEKLASLESKKKLYYDSLNSISTSKVTPLTNIQEQERKELVAKSENVELTEGAKTHCKKWLKEFLYGRREELKNKYVEKGNECEEDSFTLMALELKLGMVYKNTELRSNEYSKGTCDLDHDNIIYDAKSSWSLDTFPMFESKLPDIKYWWQLQNYSTLWTCNNLCLCYTLVDSTYEMVENAIRWAADADERYKITERMVFTKKQFEYMKGHFFESSTLNTFIEIPQSARIKPFYFAIDTKAQKTIKERSLMCQEYIFKLLTNP